MYEDMTFEDILERMLDRIPSTIDKREGSIIYDALAPAAVELQLMYMEFDIILNETFADTASREYLIKRAAERGVIPYPATHAILQATSTPNTVEIPIGSRFSLNDLNYVVIERLASGTYKVQCETVGVVGNKYTGDMIPIDYIEGLETITIINLLIPGEDEEETEDIRTRYFQTFDTKAFGGNKKDYIQKTNAIPGVGSTKVTPVWDGGGTVLLTILNSEYNTPSEALIRTVAQEIDPTQDGTGVGIAPIGHVVTVRPAEEVTVNITTTITFQEGYSFNSQKTAIENIIKEYLLEIRKAWADEDASVVRVSQIETRILNVTGVVDVTNTKINGASSNLVLDKYQVPQLGGVSND